MLVSIFWIRIKFQSIATTTNRFSFYEYILCVCVFVCVVLLVGCWNLQFIQRALIGTNNNSSHNNNRIKKIIILLLRIWRSTYKRLFVRSFDTQFHWLTNTHTHTHVRTHTESARARTMTLWPWVQHKQINENEWKLLCGKLWISIILSVLMWLILCAISSISFICRLRSSNVLYFACLLPFLAIAKTHKYEWDFISHSHLTISSLASNVALSLTLSLYARTFKLNKISCVCEEMKFILMYINFCTIFWEYNWNICK